MIRNLAIKLIKWYKKHVSPQMAPCCRFQPTCSTYMLEALEGHGLWKGLFLGIKRLYRCNPRYKGLNKGEDPVPPVDKTEG